MAENNIFELKPAFTRGCARPLKRFKDTVAVHTLLWEGSWWTHYFLAKGDKRKYSTDGHRASTPRTSK